jgi:hypothetical protein
MTRVGVGRIWHETNTYSSRPDRLDDFAALEPVDGDALVSEHAGHLINGPVLES